MASEVVVARHQHLLGRPGYAAAGAGGRGGVEAAGGWRLAVGFVVFSRTRFCSVLWSRSPSHRSAPCRKSDVGLGAPFSDVTVCRTASLWNLDIIPRARYCDTLPTCHATVYGDFLKNFLRIST